MTEHIGLIPPSYENDPIAAKSIIESDGTINLWSGAVRSRKTITSIFAFLTHITLNSKLPGLYLMIGKTLDTLEANILIPLATYLPESIFEYSKGRRKATLKNLNNNNDSLDILLISANNEGASDRLRGKTVACCLADEVTLFPQSFMDMLLSRLSLDESKAYMTTNPDNPSHYINTNIILRKHEPELNIRVFEFNLEDNPYISDNKKKQLRSLYTGLFYDRFILGRWVAASNSIYPMFNPSLHVLTNSFEYIYNVISSSKSSSKIHIEKCIIGCDWGTTNPTCYLAEVMLSNGELIIVREYYYKNTEHGSYVKTTEEFAVDLKEFITELLKEFILYKIHISKIDKIIIDPSAASLIESVKRQKVGTVLKANNDVMKGIQQTCSLYHQNKHLVDSSCKNLIREAQSYSWKENSTNKEEPNKIDDHAVDTDRYVVNHFFGKKRGYSVKKESLHHL